MNEDLPARERFAEAYRGPRPPWDIEGPQPTFVQAAGEITGSVLDAGCGTGENALYFAARGRDVTGIDFLERPIAEARRKAQHRGLNVRFLVQDALRLGEWSEQFDSIIDCGLFHVFGDEERGQYTKALAAVTRPGGRVFLMCFSDREPGTHGPRRVSADELRDAFARGWIWQSLEAARFETRDDVRDIQFSEGGPHAWFCILRRQPDTSESGVLS